MRKPMSSSKTGMVRTVLSNNATVISLDLKFEGIPSSHVLWDWDTTSLHVHAAEGRQWHWTTCRWRTALRMNLMRTLVRIEVTDGQLGRIFLLALYVQTKSPTLNVAPPLKKQPPTDSNALIHVLRVHGQCQLWKEVDKPDPPVVGICVRGWEMKDGVTTPVIYAAPTAPPKLLNMVSWQCGIHIYRICPTGRCSWLPVH